MSQLPRYESYKDSGVQWLGEIPSHWKVTRLKFMAKIQNGSDYKHVQAEDGYPVIGSGGQFTYATEYLYKGESVLLGRKGTIDRPLYVNCAFWTVDTMYYTEIFNITFPKFLYYCALTVDFWKYSTQTALPSMTQTALSNLMFATPEYAEQKVIADFLDKRLAQIDSLIAKQETLLEKLAEQRIALISHAVTKGLNPDVKLKETGIKWLGQIPIHWKTIKLKFLLSSKKNSMKVGPFGSDLKGDDFQTSGCPVYNQRTVLDNDFENGTAFISEEKLEDLSGFKVEPLDILITTRGTVGKVAIAPEHVNEGIIHPCIIKFSIDREKVLDKLLMYFFNDIEYAFQQFILASGTTTIPVIYSETLKNIIISLPPFDEQIEIIDYLAVETKKLDDMKEVVVKTITKLKEYRSTLITQVVTGKIDVRNLKVN